MTVAKFPEWRGYEDLEKMKQLIKIGCNHDVDEILEYAAKMNLERIYFNDLLLFIQHRIQKHIEEGEGLGLGMDSSKEIFEGLMIVPAENVSFPNEEKEDEDNYERFAKDMEKAGIDYEEYHGRFFFHGPAVRTKENGFPTREDVIRATKVKLQWDQLGLDYIVYPV